ncbi:hypothetical protein [Bartonella sp. CB178]|uniref:hypothetical protein n=1 Tax=Bartonella sp. CB178 TaxID=3112255 RepID=UPI00300E2699
MREITLKIQKSRNAKIVKAGMTSDLLETELITCLAVAGSAAMESEDGQYNTGMARIKRGTFLPI